MRVTYVGKIDWWFLTIGFLFIPLAIYLGWELGYVLARAICGLAIFSLLTANLDPFGDFELAHISHFSLLLETLPFACLAGFLFYCLQEHAKLRGLKWTKKEKGMDGTKMRSFDLYWKKPKQTGPKKGWLKEWFNLN